MSKPLNFNQGFACALASLARDHGQPAMAIDIMHIHGVTLQNLTDSGVDEFDLKPLREEWAENKGAYQEES